LNVHFVIPVLNKAGRGLPFTYNLVYDGSIWIPVTSNGSTSWVPTNNGTMLWGWNNSMPRGGYMSNTASTTSAQCARIEVQDPPDPPYWTWEYEYTTVYTNWAYYDGWGTRHPFPGSTINKYPGGPVNGSCPLSSTSFATTATDNSGYTISVTGGEANSLVAPNGSVINPYSAAPTPLQDKNGNEITSITSSGTTTFTDTLGTTALTISGAPPSQVTYQYAAPGGSAKYTMTYQQYTVKTKFGVSGIQEYGPLANSLVNSIVLPDGSQYLFTYEVTPGSCTPLSGTYSSNCVTGRLAEVTLPTGGQITYAYTGGSNGIESDGSTAGLNRPLNPGGEWKYSRSLVSGTPGPGSIWTTTVFDPNGNETTINFAEDGTTTTSTTIATYNFYETLRQVYQLLGRAGIKCSAPLLHRRALRAHMNFLQFACNVPIETERYVPLAPQSLRSLSFEPLPRLRHCPRQGMPIVERSAEKYGNWQGCRDDWIGKPSALLDS
jgi:hypothetical protein